MLKTSPTALLAAALAVVLFSGSAARAGPTATATFAAGCYWCVESDFDKVKGVIETTPGFMGGTAKNPTYREVSSGQTGHTEVVIIKYDPSLVSYQQLLDHYWVNVDPLDAGGQFCDRGSQYRPEIFVYNAEQRQLAEASKEKIVTSKRFDKPVIVKITDASEFTPAPDPDFYLNNPLRYRYYRSGCGRDARLQQLWGDKATH